MPEDEEHCALGCGLGSGARELGHVGSDVVARDLSDMHSSGEPESTIRVV
jgi:hypothetical protein